MKVTGIRNIMISKAPILALYPRIMLKAPTISIIQEKALRWKQTEPLKAAKAIFCALNWSNEVSIKMDTKKTLPAISNHSIC